MTDKVRCIDSIEAHRKILFKLNRRATPERVRAISDEIDRLENVINTKKLCGCRVGQCKRYD